MPEPAQPRPTAGRSPVGRAVVLVLAACLALGACTLVKLADESRAFYASTVLVGRIVGPAGWNGPVVVAALRLTDGRAEVVHSTRLHEPGGYELIVPPGEYDLFAFGDVNGNGVVDAGEPAGRYPTTVPVAAPGNGVIAALDLTLGDALIDARRLPPGAAFGASTSAARSTQAGALADLDAATFSAANGVRGYWAPLEFFKDSGGNVYFLEPYDPARIPVLFVHGAAGSAQDWRAFIADLDRSRYQPWIFQYPSGASVDSMAYLLFWKLFNLQLKHRFEQLVITAHSMGGLVARAFLLNHGSQLPQTRLFVTLSTPWAGEASAELGVRHSPAVVPSWHDMQPRGRFLQTLFARRLPPEIDYYLLFGHRGGYSLLRPNNDGTVTLASQLRSSAQAEARMIFGFDDDHLSILSSPPVLQQFRALLDGVGQRGGMQPRPGRLRVAFSIDGAAPSSAALPLLLLRPVGDGATRQRDALTLTLATDDSGRSIGPVPAGAYDVSLVAAGFRSAPRTVRVRLGADQTPALAFRLEPQGTLGGYVGEALDPVQGPAGSYRRPHSTIRIRSIKLSGAGALRELVPRAGSSVELLESYLLDHDDAVHSGFSFVGLPAGDYELSIVADGHRPHRSRHQVVPGRQQALMPVVLEPLP